MAAARPQIVQQTPGEQIITLVPFNGGVPMQNQPGQVVMLPATSGIPSFGGISSFGGAPLILLRPAAAQAPVIKISLPTAPVDPVPAQIVVNPVTVAPVVVRPPPVQPVAVPVAKPVSVSVPEKSEPAKYTYSYEVNDPSTGDAKSASETRNGDKVTGFYTVADPDGTSRRVQYTADVNGFVAVVETKPSAVSVPVVAAKPFVAVGQVPAPAAASSGAKVSTQFSSPFASFQWGTA